MSQVIRRIGTDGTETISASAAVNEATSTKLRIPLTLFSIHGRGFAIEVPETGHMASYEVNPNTGPEAILPAVQRRIEFMLIGLGLAFAGDTPGTMAVAVNLMLYRESGISPLEVANAASLLTHSCQIGNMRALDGMSRAMLLSVAARRPMMPETIERIGTARATSAALALICRNYEGDVDAYVEAQRLLDGS